MKTFQFFLLTLFEIPNAAEFGYNDQMARKAICVVSRFLRLNLPYGLSNDHTRTNTPSIPENRWHGIIVRHRNAGDECIAASSDK